MNGEEDRGNRGADFVYYDHGWNARVRGEPYKHGAAKDWRDGWKDADEAPAELREELA